MSAPIIWIAIPGVLSLLLLFIQNRTTRAFSYLSICVILALLTLIIKIDSVGNVRFYEFNVSSSLLVLGRRFVINETEKNLIAFVYSFTAIWGGLIYLYDRKTNLIPLSLLFISLLMAAFTVEPFLYSALIIEIAAIICVPILYNRDAVKKTGAIQFLTYQTLSMPFILLSGWFLAGGEITPVGAEQLNQATLLLGMGFIFWLAILPLHSWIPIFFQETNSVESGFMIQIYFFFLFLIILNFFNGFAWLREYPVVIQSFRMLGVLMSIFGATGCVFSDDHDRVIGYVLIHLLGVTLLTIGVLETTSVDLFANHLGSMLLSFALLSFSFSSVRNFSDEEDFENDNSAYGLIGMIGLIISFFSITGMPLTIGFSSMQSLYLVLADNHPISFVILLISKFLLSLIVFQYVRSFIERKKVSIAEFKIGRKDMIFLLVVVGFVFVGLFPKFGVQIFENLTIGFENLLQ